MSKKWYSYFVVTDGPNAEAGAGTDAPAAPERRASELAASDDAEPAAPVAASAPVDLSEVYASAKIESPAHGYSVLKVAEMLKSEHLQSLPADVKRKSILVALDAAGASVDDVVRDAVRRDKALDTYERVLEQHVADVQARVDAENRQIEAEIAEKVAALRARIDENTRAAAADAAEFRAWRQRKQQEENLIADAISYFVTENPITHNSPAGAPAKGEADAR